MMVHFQHAFMDYGDRFARPSLDVTVRVYGDEKELCAFVYEASRAPFGALEPLRVKRCFDAMLIDKTVVVGGIRVADCTTQEAAEAALRLLK